MTIVLESSFLGPMDERIREAVSRGMQQHRIVGCSVARVTRDRTPFEIHAGWAHLEKRILADADTIWDWGSITKLLCGWSLMQLRDRGLVKLDDLAVTHYPLLSKLSASFTLEQLLSHTSGLQSGSTPEPLPPGAPYPTWAEFEAALPRLKIEAPPGARYQYSNLGLMIVGRIVERLAGEDWETFAHKNILMPLSMNEAYFDRTPAHLADRHAESYTAEARPYGKDVDHGATTSNGGLKASLRDMTRFAQFLLAGHAPLSEMMSPRRDIGEGKKVGLAFHWERFAGKYLVGHGGSSAGYRAWLYVYPERSDALLVAVNTDSGKAFFPAVAEAFVA